MSTINRMNPVDRANRIIILDIIRGFALFGILLVNMAYYNSPKFFISGTEIRLFDGVSSQIAHFIMTVFATGKFFTIFSFLFGLGFFLFIDRVQEKDLSVVPLYRRRLFFLFLLGVIHAIFIWSGDILLPYSIAGLFLLLFRKKSEKTIRKWAVVLFIFVNLIIGFITFLATLVEKIIANDDQYEGLAFELVKEALHIYQNGSVIDILLFRLTEEVPLVLFNLLVTVPFVLSVFLFGLYVGKKGVLKNIASHLTWIHQVWKTSLIYSVILTGALIVVKLEVIIIPFYFHLAVTEILSYVTGLIVCFFYITSLTLLCMKEGWLKKLTYLAPVGQMALTNYLMQTILCVTFFWGASLYGKVTPEVGIFITIVIFLLQIVFSNYWLRKYRFGPMEWLWRSFTYKQRV